MQRDRYNTLQVIIEATGQDYDGLVNLKKVRIVESSEVNSTAKLKKLLGKRGSDSAVGALSGMRAYQKNDPQQLRDAYKLLSKELFVGMESSAFPKLEEAFVDGAMSFTLPRGTPKESRTSVKSAEYFLPNLVNLQLKDTQLVLWWNSKRKQFETGILCPNYQSAVFARFILNGVLGIGLRVCPRCHKTFQPAHPEQDYDKPECREAHRIARWRERRRTLKAQNSKRGGS